MSTNTAFYPQLETFEKHTLQKLLDVQNVIFYHWYSHDQDVPVTNIAGRFFHVNKKFKLNSNVKCYPLPHAI